MKGMEQEGSTKMECKFFSLRSSSYKSINTSMVIPKPKRPKPQNSESQKPKSKKEQQDTNVG